MDDFYAGQPWQKYRDELTELKLVGNISYVGADAFPDYDALKTVDFGSGLTEIGQGAFSGCDGLETVSLPQSFRIFGEESFSHCKNLKEFHFEGGFPKFKLNCLWDTYAKLYYPAERPWPVELVQQLEEAFQGRIEFLASDGTDPYEPQKETEAPAAEETAAPAAEPVTEPTALPGEMPAVPEPEKPTEAPAEVLAEPEKPTEVPTAPTEIQPSVTEEYVEFPDPEKVAEENDGIGLPLIGLIALMAVSGGAALLMLGRMSGNRKKEFDGNFSEILLEDEKKKPSRKKPTAAQKKARSASGRKGGKYQSRK